MNRRKVLLSITLTAFALSGVALAAPLADQEFYQQYPDMLPQPANEPTEEEIQAAEFKRLYGQVKEKVELRPIDRAALKLSMEWQTAKRAPKPIMGTAGAVTYQYGTVTPRIICRPLRVTDIMLQPGERVTNPPSIGDSTLWSITPSSSGTGEDLTVHILVKPSMPQLATNLIVHTDRRTYIFDLVSQSKNFTPFVSFTYPEWEKQQKWKAFLAKQEEEKAKYAPTKPVSEMNHNYSISGKHVEWMPTDVADDGVKTYITLPDAVMSTELPVFYVLRGKRKEIVNYRTIGNQLIVDKIFKMGVLVAGTGTAADQVYIHRRLAK